MTRRTWRSSRVAYGLIIEESHAMDRFRQFLSTISTQLSELNVSQRIAIALCAALIVGSLLWLLQWSTTPEMVPVVSEQFSFESLDSAEVALNANDIDYRIGNGNRIFVRSSDRHNAIRVLHASQSLPDGSLFDMATVVGNNNPFQSPDARIYAQNYALGNELAKIISTTPTIQSANVIVNQKHRRRLGLASDVPTASANVMLVPGVEMTPSMIDGVARLISGAVPGLKSYNVTVRDSRSGRSYNPPHPDDSLSFDYLDSVKKHEQHLLSKIMAQLADIPGVRASVTVDLDTNRRRTEKFSHDDPQPKVEKRKSSESNSSSQPAESGMQANTGTAVTASGGAQSSTTEDSDVENFAPLLIETETIDQMPLSRKRVTATVSIPRSYIVGLVQKAYPDKENVKDDDAEFVAITDRQVSRVREEVDKIVMADNPEDVRVGIYPDMQWTAASDGWQIASGETGAGAVDVLGDDTMTLVGTYGPSVGLALMAMVSMFMVSRMTRKSEDAASDEASMDINIEAGDEPYLAGEGNPVGQAALSESLLMGREVDDESLRYQELGDEVSRLVENDPKGAAALIRRWVENDEIAS